MEKNTESKDSHFWEFLDFMPEQASSWASEVDWINNFISLVAFFCTVAITATVLWFAFRYRKRKGHKTLSTKSHNTAIEIIWTFIPTAVVVFVFWQGLSIYSPMREPPANALEINVLGQKWSWIFTYDNGKKTFNELVVPINTPVRLVMKSRDVHHSFFIPAMRIKEDVIPGSYHHTWFEAIKTGDFPIFCTEYCGTKHYDMRATLKVVSAMEFKDFLLDRMDSKTPSSPSAFGEKLYISKTCNACHSVDGSQLVGPSFKGIYKTQRKMDDGTEIFVDENYLRESILNPNAKIVAGYPPQMPAFEGLLKEEEIEGLISFIKTLNEEG